MSSISSTTRGDSLILLAALVWGLAFYFQKTAMAHIGPFLFLGLRGMIAAAVLAPFALREQRRRRAGSVTPIALLAGLLFFISGALQQFGLVTATVTNTGFLTALYVVATPFAYWLILRRRPSAIVWVTVALSFAGIWALGGGSVRGLSDGDALVAVAVLGWGLLIVVTGESARFNAPLTYTLIQFAVTGILGLGAAALFEPIAPGAIASALPSVLYVGIFSSALTFGLLAVALQYIAAPRAAVLLSVETLVAALAGYLLLGERLTALGLLGAVLIMCAVLVIRLAPGKR